MPMLKQLHKKTLLSKKKEKKVAFCADLYLAE
mgnify:FL=1